ncbi:hypothetical protein PF008_g24351 [Phytophthora fragariae]|uniref:Uncharacterized protein n=1 Tax=Phytophthora fragariae TaxID=53985 RepID=A0A6G0QN97_9STRA|nr:hypothetical protein PF008_g24351 [Phytophthora fragariae]
MLAACAQIAWGLSTVFPTGWWCPSTQLHALATRHVGTESLRRAEVSGRPPLDRRCLTHRIALPIFRGGATYTGVLYPTRRLDWTSSRSLSTCDSFLP